MCPLLAFFRWLEISNHRNFWEREKEFILSSNNLSFINQINERRNNKFINRRSYNLNKSNSKRDKFFSANNLIHINLDVKYKKIKPVSNYNSLEKNFKT